MNLIFLDIDEVLTSILYANLNYEKRMSFLEKLEKKYVLGNVSNIAREKYIESKVLEIDPGCAHNLNMLVTQTDSKVVICSTWRKEYPFNIDGDTEESVVERFKLLFKKLGYEDFPVIGFTGHTGNRGVDIALYMEKNSHLNIEKYLVIDDTPEYFTKNLKTLTEDELLKEGRIFHNENNCYFKSSNDLNNKNLFFWSKQPLICTSGITGLTSKDVLDGIVILSNDIHYKNLLKEHNDFKDVKKTYNINKYENEPDRNVRNKM